MLLYIQSAKSRTVFGVSVLTAFELSAFINTLANVLAEKLDTQSAALAAAIFTQLGDTLATIAVADASEDKSDG